MLDYGSARNTSTIKHMSEPIFGRRMARAKAQQRKRYGQKMCSDCLVKCAQDGGRCRSCARAAGLFEGRANRTRMHARPPGAARTPDRQDEREQQRLTRVIEALAPKTAYPDIRAYVALPPKGAFAYAALAQVLRT